MSSKKIDASHFSPDTQTFLYLLYKYEVEYVIVGGEAVIYYGHVRLTGDIDFFFSPSGENIKRLYNALNEFWDGNIPEISGPDELGHEGLILQYGVPPNRIDLINAIDKVDFDQAWKTRDEVQLKVDGEQITIYFIGIELLIENKEQVKRHKDLEDLEFLRKVKKK